MATNPYVTRDPDYADLDLDFMPHPTTGDVMKKTGEEAIKRSVRNLIMTNYYDRPFQSGIGSDVRALLFENITPLTAIYLQDAITIMLNRWEPRIRLDNVKVTADVDNNGFNVRLEYIILNRESPVVTTIFLERIR
jgi:phage baseplate assembly protein W